MVEPDVWPLGPRMTSSPYGLGSFCTHNGLLHFCTFVPNFLYTPGMLDSLYLTSANRAEEMSRVLTDQGWEGVNYDVAKSRRAP